MFLLIYLLIIYVLVDTLVYMLLRNNTFLFCIMMIYVPFTLSNQIELDLKSINQEFILFLLNQQNLKGE